MDVWLHIKTSFQDTFHFRAGEWATACILTLWGLQVYGQPGLFTDNPVFSEFGRLAPQAVWALGALSLGGCRLLVLLVNGAWRRSYHARATTAFFSCFFWMEISLSMYSSGSSTTGLAVYPVLLFLDSYYVLRATSEARREDDKYKGRTGVHGGRAGI